MFGAKALRAGLFLIVSILSFMLIILSLGERAKMFTKMVTYKTKFKNVSGLAMGADVSIAGVLIGDVAKIELPSDVTDHYIIVEFKVEKDKTKWIRKDTRTWIKTMGLLGDKYIELTQGSVTEEPLPPGSFIESIPVVSVDEVLKKGDNMVDNFMVLIATAREVVEKVNRGEGLLGRLVTDEELSKSFTDDAKDMITRVRNIVDKVDNGQGALGVLINDRKSADEIMDNLKNFSHTLKDIGETIDRGESLAGRILMDEKQGTQMFENFTKASDSLKDFTIRMNPNSVVGRLTSDDEYADELLTNINTISDSVAKITEKVASGEGTLGKLVYDESMYQGATDIIQGINNSKLTRWFLKRSQAGGAKVRLKKEKLGKSAAE
jgi:phospholipid/cholesterol/gamma-HCH transport system substrate-binding protein